MSQEQRGCLGIGLKIFALVLVVGLILSLPLALAGRSFGRVIFRPAILSAVVRNSVLASGVLDAALQESLSHETLQKITDGEDDLWRFFEYLTAGEREEILRAVLPEEWVENQFTQVMRNFYAWLNDDQPMPSIALDLEPLKTNLLRGGINTFVDTVVDSWPSCKPEQVEALQQEFFQGGGFSGALCEPPEPWRARVIDLAMIGFEDQVRQLPESIPLIEPIISMEDLAATKNTLRGFRTLMLWGWMLPFSLLGLIMAFVVRSWPDVGRWWGVPLLWAAGGTFLLALLLSAIRDDLISEWLGGGLGAAALQSVFTAALNGLYTAGLGTLWLQAFMVCGIGLVLWLAGRRAGRKAQSKPDAGPPIAASGETKILAQDEQETEFDEQGEPPAGIFG